MAVNAVYDYSLLDHASADRCIVVTVPPVPVVGIETDGHFHHEHQPANFGATGTSEMHLDDLRAFRVLPGARQVRTLGQIVDIDIDPLLTVRGGEVRFGACQ